jgi:photosystem II stability/assembly factor-like uncharacterized protein
MCRSILVYILLIIGFTNSIGQVSIGGIPPSFSQISSLKSSFNPEFVIPPDVIKLKQEDASNRKPNAPYRIAENITVEFNIEYNGKWDTLSSGEIIWQLKIYSPGAQGLRLIFDNFYLPEGSRLFVYNESKDFIIGAFTKDNNHPSGKFATEIVPGDVCILEYVAPRNFEKPIISINQIGYIYRGIDDIIPEGSRTKATGNCEVNVNCSPEGDNWKDVKRSVTKIILDKYLCSGTLLNNTARNFKSYIATAFHCIDSIENTAATWVFYFNYERSTCSNTSAKISYKTLTGSKIKAAIPLKDGGDGALLELFGSIPASYNAYWVGWDRLEGQYAGGVGIHHPQGDCKKISTCRSDWFSTTWHGVGNVDGARGAHYSLVFSKTANGHGVTEGGSSGSGLFGADELYRGSLSGGLSDCDNPNYDNLYGKLSYNWDKYSSDSTKQFMYWLDPVKSGETRIGGIELNTSTNLKPYWTSSKSVIFVDSIVKFKDETIGNDFTRLWRFEGGIPETSTEKEPIIKYSNSGIFDVTLELSKNGIVYSKVRTDYIVTKARPAWIPQNTGFPDPAYGIQGISIVDSLNVWAWAIDLFDTQKNSIAFTRTIDGGDHWKADTIKLEGIFGCGIGNVFALTGDTAYATVYAPSAIGGGKVVCTFDGGKNWQYQSTALFSAPNGFPNSVYFFNKNEGVCIGDPNGGYFEIYTTENGGNIWNRVVPSKIPASITDEYGTTNFYDAKSDTIWFGTTKGRIYKSIDKGKNWNVSNTGLTGSTDIKFRDSKLGFAIKRDAPYTIKKTLDGGLTWSDYNLPANFLKGDITYVPGTKSTWVSVVFNDPSGSSYSIDDGTTFNVLETGIPYSAVSFYNARIGWAGSFNIDSINGGIYKWNYNNWYLTSLPKSLKKNPDFNNYFNVFPNPVSDKIMLKANISLIGPLSINIYAINGKKVLSTSAFLDESKECIMDVSSFKPGVYILEVVHKKAHYITKVFKNNF